MKYDGVYQAQFIRRPNRFIAVCRLEGKEVVAHVKNTGRCAELLREGVTVYLTFHSDPSRKTAYSLVAVEKGGLLLNIDSQAPNKVVGEALATGQIPLPGLGELRLIRPETRFGQSRFDFYLEGERGRGFLEVKGVTLEEEGTAYFPDAPTQRGVKHIEELIAAKEAGYEAFLFFLLQMKGISPLKPNDRTHPAFGEALRKAADSGVRILAYDAQVEPDALTLGEPVAVCLW